MAAMSERYRMRVLVLPALAVLAFTVVYFGLLYAFGGRQWSWYWWPVYPVGAIVIAFLVAAFVARRRTQRSQPTR